MHRPPSPDPKTDASRCETRGDAPTPDTRFKRRYIVRTLLLLVPPLVAFAVLWRESGSMGLRFWLALAFFIVWLLAWIALDRAMLRAYRCPACGQRIRTPTIPHRDVGDPIDYRCPRCDRTWSTGLRESGD